ncbi:MAG TPA: M35 family metallo-endopeptidase [Burkholderiaceae bacterium]
MNVFSEVYEKSVEMLKTPQLHADWAPIESGLKALLLADGPSPSKGEVLEDLRKRLVAAGKQAKGSADKAVGDEIVRVSQAAKPDFQDRAALIKQMKHFYMVARKGSQSIWVVDQPKSYGEWDFELFDGKSAVDLPALLARNDEVFGRSNRKMMSDALQLARKWSADTEVRLGSKSAKVEAVIRRWFLEEGASAADVESVRGTLQAGFKKITAACNSGKVIFSDRPKLRVSGDYDSTYASVNGRDAMPVIYIYQLFLQTGKRNLLGNIPKLWLCALTIVHELSHKLLATEDKRYDYQGLKPSTSFPPATALINADSWAYFCGDVLGAVPKAAVKEALS